MPRKNTPHASRTINPLHFEDLEPHRFEDLIRQLAYGFKSWLRIEATGRLGADGGMDIQGIELVPLVDTAGPDEVEDVDGQVLPEWDERYWRIQCKRYQSITPGVMRQIVEETVPDVAAAPYGIIIAAACDVSAKTMAAFHDERIKRGAIEGHLWTKAHLEDLLFLPENDHLLFVYFGLSIGTRRRSQIRKVQATITVKRKLLRAYKKTGLSDLQREDVLIRDVEDSTYPTRYPAGPENIFTVPPWITATLHGSYTEGLWVSRYYFDGWVTPDKNWDILRNSAEVWSDLGGEYTKPIKTEEEYEKNKELDARVRDLSNLIPAGERCIIRLVWRLPYEAILEIDPIGDTLHEAPHIYCRYSSNSGPFEMYLFIQDVGFEFRILKPENHRPFFEDLAKKHLKKKERQGLLHIKQVKG
jgi:hypothetical protein